MIRLSIAAYHLVRAIGVDGTFSRLILATCSITAGSVFAATEFRAILLDVYASTVTLYAIICFSLYVDDGSFACADYESDAVAIVAAATDHVAKQLEDFQTGLGLTVSTTESVAVASIISLACLLSKVSATGKATTARRAKLLGTAVCGVAKRTTSVLQKRLANLRCKVRQPGVKNDRSSSRAYDQSLWYTCRYVRCLPVEHVRQPP